MTEQPLVTVVLPVRRACDTIERTVNSLLQQCASVPSEIVAVVGESDPSRAVLARIDHPALRVIIAPHRTGVPQLRRDGVRHARAPWVVITEDHCTFPEGWLRSIAGKAGSRSPLVRGGPVTNGVETVAGWAQYFTRYTAFMPPVPYGRTRMLPGNNACYPRRVLETHAGLLRNGFWEAEFNNAILNKDCTLWMDPSLAVQQNQRRGVLEYAFLRYRHGRCYGSRRFADAAPAEKRRLLLRIPLIPAVLFWRSGVAVLRKRRQVARYLLALPLLLLYFLAWSVGEAAGYLAGPGASCLETD